METLLVTVVVSIVTSFLVIKTHMYLLNEKIKEMKEKENQQFQQYLKEVEQIVVEIVSKKS